MCTTVQTQVISGRRITVIGVWWCSHVILAEKPVHKHTYRAHHRQAEFVDEPTLCTLRATFS